MTTTVAGEPPRVAVVTGATSGIGREVARQLLAQGFVVHVGARDAGRGGVAVAELGAGARLLVLDVTDEASVRAAAHGVDVLDVLVNNAGVNPGGETAEAGGLEPFRRAYETNVFAVVAVTNAFLPALRRAAHPRIVNLSSGTGSLSWSQGDNPQFDHARVAGGGAAYRTSKAALNALTVSYAGALAAEGVKVNALAPGLRRTNLVPGTASGGDPAEAAAGAVRLALLADDGPTGAFVDWDGQPVPW